MRRIALFVPILAVVGYVVHQAVSPAETGAEAVAAPVQIAVADQQPQRPAAVTAPTPAPAPRAPTSELDAELAGLVDLALAIPATVEFDASVLQDFRLQASAKADVAATIAGLVQMLEQRVDERMSEEEVVAITGSLLAELAATLEASLAVGTLEPRVAIPDTGRSR